MSHDAASSATTEHPGVDEQNPWLGLVAFTEDLQAYFHGRLDEADELLRRVERQNLTVLFGQSGLGKSSLLQAGLFPRLRAAGYLPVAIRLDHDPRAPGLSQQVTAAVTRALVDAGGHWEPAAPEGAQTLWEHFHRRGPRLVGGDGRPLRLAMVFDQFEELFAVGQASDEARSRAAAFVAELADLVENRAPKSLEERLECSPELARQFDFDDPDHRMLVCLREDYLPHLESLRPSMPSIAENRMRLTRMNGERALDAVLNPGGSLIGREVGRQVVGFVAGRGVLPPEDTAAAAGDGALARLEVEPSLLSLVCRELNNRRLALGLPQITTDLLAGNRERILNDFYERCVSDQPSGVRAFVEDELVTDSGLRENMALERARKELSQRGAPASAIDELVRRRLLHLEDRLDIQRVELTHDVLTAVVKKSRDERHQQEVTLRAEREARDVREKARRQRKRLRLIVAGMAVALVVVGGFGVESYRLYQLSKSRLEEVERQKAKVQEQKDLAEANRREADLAKDEAIEAEKKAIAARTQAENGFESAWKGLSTLYDDYAASTLENTPGISAKQANALKSKLRGHLLHQLRQLNEEQPDHRGTIHDLARLLLDEGREAIAESAYSRAQENLTEALQWSEKRARDSALEAETYADVLLELARVASYSGDPTQASEIATRELPNVREIAASWPDSWRLEYVMIRLENVRFVSTTGTREASANLAARMAALHERSDRHFDPVLWTFVIEMNSFRDHEAFTRSAEDYAAVLKLIRWFRTNLADDNQYTLVQRELAANMLQDLLSVIQTHFAVPNVASTAEVRRDILNELESSIVAMERRLQKNTSASALKGDFLRLQESCVKDGTNTLSQDELLAAQATHRMRALGLGDPASVAESIRQAFKSYQANDTSKGRALWELQTYLKDFASLDLIDADTVLGDFDIKTYATGLPPTDPAALLYEQMVDHYLKLYQNANTESKLSFVGTVVSVTSGRIQRWNATDEHAQIAEFWDSYYAGVRIETLTSGDRSDLVGQLRVIAASLFKVNRLADATHLWERCFALCDAIITDRPWDFYIRDNMYGLCFQVAAFLGEKKDEAAAQRWLRRAWMAYKDLKGSDVDISRYSVLPQKGTVPDGIPAGDAVFFAELAPPDQAGSASKPRSALKRFNIQTDFSGVKYPFHVYVLSGKKGYQRLLDQFRWLTDNRGGSIPKETLEIFDRLHVEAERKNADYMEYVATEFPRVATEAADAQLLAMRERDARRGKQSLPPEDIAREQRELMGAYENACRCAMQSANWEKLDGYANAWLASDANNPSALSSLAIAMFAQGRIVQALDIYQEWWESRKDSQFKKAVEADVNAMALDGRAESLKRLYLIAKENNVSFPDLVKYALSDEISAQGRETSADEAVEIASERENAYGEDKSATNRQELIAACELVSLRCIHAKRWAEAEKWAAKLIELDASLARAHGYQATALLFQDSYDRALEIFKAHWRDPIDGSTLGEYVLSEFKEFEKEHIDHPDLARLKAALEGRAIAPGQDEKDSNSKVAAFLRRLGSLFAGAHATADDRYRDALPALEKAAKSPGAEADDYNRLGMCYGKLGRWDEAVAAYTRSVEVDLTTDHATGVVCNLLEALIIAERPEQLLQFVESLEEKGWRPPSEDDAPKYFALFHGFRAIASYMAGKDASEAESLMRKVTGQEGVVVTNWSWDELDQSLETTKLAPERKAAVEKIVAALKGGAGR